MPSFVLLNQNTTLLSLEIISPSMSVARSIKPINKSFNRSKPREECHKFNSGKCNFGTKCQYLHKCLKCHKFGQGMKDCRIGKGVKSAQAVNNENV